MKIIIIEIEPDILFKVTEAEFENETGILTTENNHFQVEFLRAGNEQEMGLVVNNIADGYGINRINDYANKKVTIYKEI